MKTKIYTESFNMLESGSVIIPDINEALVIGIVEDDGVPINLRFVFNYNSTISEPNINITSFDENTLNININHDGVLLNFGFLKPISIGYFNKMELFVNFRVTMNDSDDVPILNYTWLTKIDKNEGN